LKKEYAKWSKMSKHHHKGTLHRHLVGVGSIAGIFEIFMRREKISKTYERCAG
jgi:hypothetical protein